MVETIILDSNNVVYTFGIQNSFQLLELQSFFYLESIFESLMIFENWWKNLTLFETKTKISKTFTATPRQVVHFRLGSEVSTKSQDTFESQSKTLGSLQETAGTIRGERFHFWASNFWFISWIWKNTNKW